jgi:hypothetical protein
LAGNPFGAKGDFGFVHKSDRETIVGEAIVGGTIDNVSIISGANDGKSIDGVRSGSDELRRCSPR